MTKRYLPTTTVLTPADPPWGIVDPVVLDQDYDPPMRGFIAATAGNVSVVMADGSTGIYPACSAGTVYGGFIAKFNAAGTSDNRNQGLCVRKP